MPVSGFFDYKTHQFFAVNNLEVIMDVISLSTPRLSSPNPFNVFHFRRQSLCFYAICGTIFSLFFLAGCNGSDAPPVSHGGPVRDHVSLVDTLRAQGLTVEPTGPISQPFFSMPGETLRVNGQDIQVFEFKDSSSTESQAKEISSDGMSVGNTAIQWISPPHFFSTGKIIVLYLGTDQELLKELETALGKQIAGASS